MTTGDPPPANADNSVYPPSPEAPKPEKKYRIRIWLKHGAGFYDFVPLPTFSMFAMQREVRGAGGFIDDNNWIPVDSILGISRVEEVDGKAGQVVPFRPVVVNNEAPDGAPPPVSG